MFSVICLEKRFLFSKAVWDLTALHRKGLPFSGFSVAQYFDSLASFMTTLFLETFLVEYYSLTILEVGGCGAVSLYWYRDIHYAGDMGDLLKIKVSLKALGDKE